MPPVRVKQPPTIGISLGDPLGIGPEIVSKSLADKRLQSIARYRVFGEQLDSRSGTVGHTPSSEGGKKSFCWVEDAINAALLGVDHPDRVDAIVTAPISKTSWQLAGIAGYPGHTELLAERCDIEGTPFGMLFVSPPLCVMLATIHVPLMSVGRVLTTERVVDSILLAHRAWVEIGRSTHGKGPRIAVCGLNPHAGEGGILGEEDGRVIAPAVGRARAAGVDAHGPLSADALFLDAAAPPLGKGLYDCVVAMYHDQGLIPVKLLARHEAVNVTVGLPIIRTSPAHGTAFDIAGKGIADPASMMAAIRLAVELVNRKREREGRGNG